MLGCVGADKEQVWDGNGDTPLLRAVDLGRIDVVKSLIARGANVDVRDKVGQTPLIIASSRDADIARVLVDAHAAIDVRDSQGNAASHIALATGNAVTASLLRRRQSMDMIAYVD